MANAKKNDVLDFQSIFESAPDLYLILDTHFVIIGVSNAYLKATMVLREQIIGKNIFEIFPDNPDDPKATGVTNLRASFEKVINNKAPDAMAVQKYDIRRPLSSGGGFEERYWSPLNSPVFTKDNQVKYIIHRVEDVTEFIRVKQSGVEQLKIMEELRTHVGEMEIEIYQRAQEIQEVNKKLQQANKNLAQLNQIKTQFFANISHKLRTPLMLILGPIEKLLSDKIFSPTYSHDLHLVKNNALILLKHVDDLILTAKLEAGKMTLNYAEIDLTKLIGESASLFEERMKEQQINFSVIAPEHMLAQVDPEKIQRVMMNILSNTIKFTPAKGSIQIKLARHRTQARLTFTDTSAGVIPKFFDTLSERSFQAEELLPNQARELGIDLAISRDFIELHGGTIQANTLPQGGAIFKINLPLKAPTGEKIQTNRELSANLEQKLKLQLTKEFNSKKLDTVPNANKIEDLPLILVIEDNINMNSFICEVLSSHYLTESAFNGLEGLQKSLRLLPDLIISDIMMPHMNGVQLVHEIRQHVELPTIPIFILTARSDDALCIQMLREGAQDYMIKPFSINEFKVRVSNLISNKKAEDELSRFVYLASHDLKAPLPAMERLISWIEEDSAGKLPEKSKNHLSLLRSRAYRLSNLLDELLKFTQAGHVVSENLDINCQQLVEDIIQQLDPPPTFTFSFTDKLPILQTSKPLLQQVFTELLDNSIKHHHSTKGHVTIGVQERDEFYDFFVKDDGPGIDPQYHSRIFQLFQTLQPRDIVESCGVGLSIVKKIVGLQGGK